MAGLLAARGRDARGAPPPWARLAAYAPLLAALAEVPWVVACVLGLLFLVGDRPFTSTPESSGLFAVVVSLPAVAGLLCGAVVLRLGLARTPAQRVCLALGLVLCGLCVAAVVAGRVR